MVNDIYTKGSTDSIAVCHRRGLQEGRCPRPGRYNGSSYQRQHVCQITTAPTNKASLHRPAGSAKLFGSIQSANDHRHVYTSGLHLYIVPMPKWSRSFHLRKASLEK